MQTGCEISSVTLDYEVEDTLSGPGNVKSR